MERLVAFGAVLAFVSFCPTSAQKSVGTVVVDDGRIGIGHITGGNFGPGSFSINSSPGSRPKTQVNVQEDDGGSQHIVLQNGQRGSTDLDNSGGGNTQLFPVKQLTIYTNPGQGGNGEKGGNGSGQIIIGSMVLNTLKHNHNNIQPDELDAAAIESIFGSNGEDNGRPSVENGPSNTEEQGSIQIASINGGYFEEGTLNINNNNKRPGTNAPQNGNDVNNGNTVNLNVENEAQDSIGHSGNIQPDALDAAAIEAIFGSNGRNNGSPSVKNGLSNIGDQGSIQIASITGGNFEEGTLNINDNNKRPGTDVPQNGNNVNNGNNGNLNAQNEAQGSIGHGANNNDAGTIGVDSNQGQTNSGYNSGGYDEPWIWSR